MTTPPLSSLDYTRGAQSQIFKDEYEQFLARQRAIMDSIIASADQVARARAPLTPPQQQAMQPAPQMQRSQGFWEHFFAPPQITPDSPLGQLLGHDLQPNGRTAAEDELIAQARFWDIPNPESISPQQLHQMILQRRQEMPRDQQTSVGSFSMASLGAATEAAGATSRVVGNIFGDIGAIPFAGPALAKILHTEEAKRWMYDLSMSTSEFTEAARAAQPQQDLGAFEVMAATGKVGGYALPAMLAWNTIGAAAGVVPEAWAARASSPILRAALQGGITGTVLEAGSNESRESKVFNIGLGFALGAATALPKVGLSIGLGTVGAGIGAQVGDTPEERTRHAIEGGIAGALAGAAALIPGAAAKVRQDMKSPFDAKVEDAVRALPDGTPPQQAQARMAGEPQLPAGPDYTVENAWQQQEPQLLVRSEAPQAQPEAIGGGMTQRVQGPEDLARLMSPERAWWTGLSDIEKAQAWKRDAGIDITPMNQANQAPELINLAYDAATEKISRGIAGTKVVGADGLPLTVYHGTGADFEAFSPNKTDSEALYGPGFYHTESAQIASGYAGQMAPPPIPGVYTGTNQLGELPQAPQIRPARLNIQNPFDIDKAYSQDEIANLINRLNLYAPHLDWNAARQSLQPIYDHGGEDVYNVLSNLSIPPAELGQKVSRFLGLPPQYIVGKRGFNNLLQQIGYDGIKYIGGARTGNPPHQVWVAFNPEQVHSPWIVGDLSHSEAASTADQLTKQATLMESATLPATVNKAQITDTDVVQAARVSNPGGVSLIRGLQMPLRVMQEAGPGVSFVQSATGFDALIGDVTPQQVQEYSTYGVFSGQKVVTASGVEGEVSGVLGNQGMVKIRTASGHEISVRPDKVLPSRFSAPKAAPDLWDAFKNDLLSYANFESEKAGMAPVMSIFDSRVPQMMAQHQSDFLDRIGITDPGLRQAVDADFNHRWTQDLRDLDPESRDLQDGMAASAVAAANETEASPSHNIPVSLEEKAEKRGFIWLTAPGGGGSFKDTINPGSPDIPVSTDASAHEFLARVDRTLPDFTPVSDVPLDVATMLPEGLNTEPRLALEDYADSLNNTLDHFGAGGGSEPPAPPPVGGGSASSGGGWQLPRGDQPTLAQQFVNARRSDPAKVNQMVHDFQGILGSKLRYTRYAMLNMENKLANMGIDQGKAWSHYEDFETARTHAFNEGQPWIKEWSDIMKGFPTALGRGSILRDGTVTRIHEIEDPNARYAAWYRLGDSHGLSESQIKGAIAADDRITDFNHRFFEFLTGDPAFSLTADREIYRYMSHVRTRQALGMRANAYDVPLSPNVEFFAEHARHTDMQFRIMDARELGTHMVRAAMFKKWQAEPWEQMVNAWELNKPMTDEASPIPLGLRQYMADYANVARHGYNPAGELAVRGIQSVLGKFGVPVSTREAQHLLNVPQSAMYMSMLAGKSSIFFRDATQPLLALAKVQLPYMVNTYGKVLKGASQSIARTDLNDLQDMYQRGLDGGWVEKENLNLEAAGFFEEQPGASDQLSHLTPQQVQTREVLARIGDATTRLPAWLARPSESSLNTLKWYGRQGQLHRLIVGESAYNQATDVLTRYRQSTVDAVVNGDPSKEMPFDKMMEDSYFSSFEKPIQQKLSDLVNAGDDEGAAQMFAREVANWSQFRYGRREAPQALRGNIGRMGSALGSWTGQFLEAAVSALSNGTMKQKARFGMIVGGFSLAMYEAKQKTGWGFQRWAWVPFGTVFTGSPLLEHAAKGVETVMGLGNTVQGYAVSPTQQSAMAETFGDAGSGPPLATEFLPYTGYVKTAAELHAALQGTNPLEQIARYAVTGDRGSRIDIQRMIEEAAQRHGDGSLQPGQLSPAGGLIPGRPGAGAGYQFPGGGNYSFPQNPPTSHPGAGAWE